MFNYFKNLFKRAEIGENNHDSYEMTLSNLRNLEVNKKTQELRNRGGSLSFNDVYIVTFTIDVSKTYIKGRITGETVKFDIDLYFILGDVVFNWDKTIDQLVAKEIVVRKYFNVENGDLIKHTLFNNLMNNYIFRYDVMKTVKNIIETEEGLHGEPI